MLFRIEVYKSNFKMVIEYEELKPEYLEELYDLVQQNKDILKPNTMMIYYIVNRLFSEVSYVARYKGKVIGFLISFLNSSNEVWLHQLAIDKNFRKKGIAKALILNLEKKCIGKKINFSVKETNTSAIHLYTKLGYTSLGFEKAINQLLFEKRL